MSHSETSGWLAAEPCYCTSSLGVRTAELRLDVPAYDGRCRVIVDERLLRKCKDIRPGMWLKITGPTREVPRYGDRKFYGSEVNVIKEREVRACKIEKRPKRSVSRELVRLRLSTETAT